MVRSPLLSTWQARPSDSLTPPTWQALRRSLPETHRQRHPRDTRMPPPRLHRPGNHLSHVMLTCPVSQAVWHWFASIWAAVSQQRAPPLHADLLLADDRRGPWQPSADLVSLWQRLRLLVIAQLWTSYCSARSRPGHLTSPAHIAARILTATREQMRQDWLLIGADIRLRAGVLSHWLRGRQPTMSAQQFQQRWCHADILCSLPADEGDPPLIHWTAAHPVPLPI